MKTKIAIWIATLLACCILLEIQKQAHAGEVWLDIHTTSLHASDEKFNRNNFGIGTEYTWSDKLVMVGRYNNSLGTQSRYILAGWTPMHYRSADVGFVFGALDGYKNMNNGRAAPALGGIIRFNRNRMGTNIMVFPPVGGSPAALGLSFRVRF